MSYVITIYARVDGKDEAEVLAAGIAEKIGVPATLNRVGSYRLESLAVYHPDGSKFATRYADGRAVDDAHHT